MNKSIIRTSLAGLAFLPAWLAAQTAMPNAALPDKGAADSGMVVKPPPVGSGETVKAPPASVDPGILTPAPSMEQAAKEQARESDTSGASGASRSGNRRSGSDKPDR